MDENEKRFHLFALHCSSYRDISGVRKSYKFVNEALQPRFFAKKMT
jgi:hypothetical protein